jgi:plastocyanin
MTEFVNRGWMVLLLTAACTLFANSAEVTATVHVDRPSARQISPANVVVWLMPVDSAEPKPVPKPNVRLLQKDKQFLPHLLVIPTGTVVDFPNLDPFFHNVFSLFNGKRFDLGLYEAGSHRAVTFDREGISYIFCNIHPEMGAVVVSLSSPWFAVSDTNGAVVIHDVPPGRYKLQMWAEQLTPSSSIRMNEIIDVPSESYHLGALEFRPANAVTMHHKNKFGKDYTPETHSAY